MVAKIKEQLIREMASRTGMGRAEVAVQVDSGRRFSRPQTHDIGTDMEDAIDAARGEERI
jgi:hypothetical protein